MEHPLPILKIAERFISKVFTSTELGAVCVDNNEDAAVLADYLEENDKQAIADALRINIDDKPSAEQHLYRHLRRVCVAFEFFPERAQRDLIESLNVNAPSFVLPQISLPVPLFPDAAALPNLAALPKLPNLFDTNFAQPTTVDPNIIQAFLATTIQPVQRVINRCSLCGTTHDGECL